MSNDPRTARPKGARAGTRAGTGPGSRRAAGQTSPKPFYRCEGFHPQLPRLQLRAEDQGRAPDGYADVLQQQPSLGELDVDRAAFPTYADPAGAARSAEAWSVGLNWWLNTNLRVLTSFSRTTFEGGGKGTSPSALVTAQPESVLFIRFQLAF